VPLEGEDQSRFLYHQPPVQLFEELPPTVPRNQGLEDPLPAPLRMGQPSRNFPREPLRR
jgi:hypothetical protein